MTNFALTTAENIKRSQLLVKEFNLPAAPDPSDVNKTESGFNFTYYEIETTKKKYCVNQSEYNRIRAAINDGMTFVSIDGDVISLKPNQIKHMEKSQKHLNMTKIVMDGRVARQVLDTERIAKFNLYLGI